MTYKVLIIKNATTPENGGINYQNVFEAELLAWKKTFERATDVILEFSIKNIPINLNEVPFKEYNSYLINTVNGIEKVEMRGPSVSQLVSLMSKEDFNKYHGVFFLYDCTAFYPKVWSGWILGSFAYIYEKINGSYFHTVYCQEHFGKTNGMATLLFHEQLHSLLHACREFGSTLDPVNAVHKAKQNLDGLSLVAEQIKTYLPAALRGEEPRLPVDLRYGKNRSWRDLSRERMLAFSPVTKKVLGRLPTSREIHAVIYGDWSWPELLDPTLATYISHLTQAEFQRRKGEMLNGIRKSIF